MINAAKCEMCGCATRCVCDDTGQCSWCRGVEAKTLNATISRLERENAELREQRERMRQCSIEDRALLLRLLDATHPHGATNCATVGAAAAVESAIDRVKRGESENAELRAELADMRAAEPPR